MLGAWVMAFGLAAASLATTTPRTKSEEPVVLVGDPGQLFVSPLSIEPLPERRWIVHRVRPRDTVEKIAARYGVTIDDVLEWNRLAPSVDLAKRRRTVRVFTRRVPPPVVRVAYVVQEGESWDDIAAKLRVSSHELRTTHWRMRTPVAGSKVVTWVDPIDAPAFDPNAPDIVSKFEIPKGGRSIGVPNKGRIENAVQLPESPLWVRGQSRKLWGSSHTIATIHRAFTTLRNDVGYRPGVLIGAISHKHGGKFPPHRSHQSGRDIDIRLPLKIGSPVKHASVEDIDWYATWALIDAFVRTGEVESVFLDIERHERLYTAARALGVPREQLRDIVRWPNTKGNIGPLVRHADGHQTHIHVRIRCAKDEPRCSSGP